MEYMSGSMAGVFACIFTNPLDVVKTRLQLQGELKARGQHVVHYKNTIHAFYVIAKSEGITSIQKGLVPALWFQVFLNGVRLGTVGTLSSWGWTRKSDESVSMFKTAMVSALAGCSGSFIGSPFYLIKTQLQSQAANEIAVGYQHNHKKTFPALMNIYKNEGIKGLWRGSVSSLPRVGVGSSVQLSTFSVIKEFLENHEILSKEKSLWNSFVASMCCGVAVAFFMTPFDVVQTRMYNQGNDHLFWTWVHWSPKKFSLALTKSHDTLLCLDKNGRGLLYSGIIDCFVKTVKAEGLFGLFKGIGPCYLRIGPHSLLTLVFWDFLKKHF